MTEKQTIRLIVIIVISVILTLAAFVTFVCFELFHDRISHDINKYNEARVYSYNSRMPEIEELNPYSKISYTYYEWRCIFVSETHTLIADYDEKDYTAKKTELQSKLKAVDEFTFDGYDFIMLEKEEIDDIYPHDLYFYGFNDDTYQIAFIHFYDSDLDYIVSRERFFYEYLGWNIATNNSK